jgi:hypothetical protein
VQPAQRQERSGEQHAEQKGRDRENPPGLDVRPDREEQDGAGADDDRALGEPEAH